MAQQTCSPMDVSHEVGPEPAGDAAAASPAACVDEQDAAEVASETSSDSAGVWEMLAGCVEEVEAEEPKVSFVGLQPDVPDCLAQVLPVAGGLLDVVPGIDSAPSTAPSVESSALEHTAQPSGSSDKARNLPSDPAPSPAPKSIVVPDIMAYSGAETAGPREVQNSRDGPAPSPVDALRQAKSIVVPDTTAKLGTATARPRTKLGGRSAGRIPREILEDDALNDAIAKGLPSTHEFEIHKTVWRLRKAMARHVGLQLPEGLQYWATTLAEIFRRFVDSVQTATIMGDVTFGACCIDDLGAQAVGVDCLIHYGHSCLVPTDQTTLTTFYVLVEININVAHLVETVRLNFTPEQRIAFMGSVQFTGATQEAVKELQKDFFLDDGGGKVPQVRPLGMGETLGCTSPLIGDDIDVVIFVCDGRFHLESAMIQNPHVKGGFYRYDPMLHTLTREGFDHTEMHRSRRGAIEQAADAKMVGLILGTLGRQGSVGVMEEVERLLEERDISHFTLLLSDVSPDKLKLFETVDAWVQVACPRLSVDWGDAYPKPLLTPYEAHVAFGKVAYKDVYPMDYYSNRGGPWANYGTHNGHGGSAGEKFRHLRSRKTLQVEYENQ